MFVKKLGTSFYFLCLPSFKVQFLYICIDNVSPNIEKKFAKVVGVLYKLRIDQVFTIS